MMSASAEGAERLANILREILALSETKRGNHSKPADANDPNELFDAQSANGIDQPCAWGNRQPTGAGSPGIRIVFNSNSGFYA